MPAHPAKRGRRPLPVPPEVVLPTMALHGFGLRLAQLRKSRGWSQTGLARSIHARDEAVRLWETCKHFPSFTMLHRLRAALECDWTALMGK